MKKVLVAMAVVGLAAMGGGAAADNGANGVWIMDNGKVTVRVAPCGGNLCGTVVALKKPRNDAGQPRLDKENPNPSLRSRSVIGLTILSNMKPDGGKRWNGTIYNPDDGRSYRSQMKMQDTDTMKVDGCVMIFCKSMKFTRLQ